MDRLSAETVTRLRDAFDLFSAEREMRGGGKERVVTATELLAVLVALHLPLTPAEAQDLLTRFDVHGNGSLCFAEFCQLLASDALDDADIGAELEEVYSAADRDGDGVLGVQDIVQLVAAHEPEEEARDTIVSSGNPGVGVAMIAGAVPSASHKVAFTPQDAAAIIREAGGTAGAGGGAADVKEAAEEQGSSGAAAAGLTRAEFMALMGIQR